MHYCWDHGIRVPEQVAIAGFDNLPEARVTSPSLTTVGYPIQSMAQLAVKSVTDPLSGPEQRPCYNIFLEPKLVVRRSTDAAAGKSKKAEMAEMADDVSSPKI
jgi:LacI family transcriptional regulator